MEITELLLKMAHDTKELLELEISPNNQKPLDNRFPFFVDKITFWSFSLLSLTGIHELYVYVNKHKDMQPIFQKNVEKQAACQI